MKRAKTLLKLVVAFSVVIVACTSWPDIWAGKLEALMERPAVRFEAPEDYWQDVTVPVEVLERKAMADIRELSDPRLKGRRAGTAGETKAMVYLEEQLKALHLLPFGDENNYWQMFPIPGMKETLINGRFLFRPDPADLLRNPSANILAWLPGKDPKQTLIISAHYDHLGIYQGKLYPGANDNASGVGCVLEVTRRLTAEALAGKRPAVNIVIAFWGAEEMGFLGSNYFVSKPTIPLSSIRAVINYDSVAIGRKEDFILWSTDGPLVETVRDTVNRLGGTIEKVPGNGHASDERSFLQAGVPAATLLSRQWLDKNHTPQDDIADINEEKLDLACDILYELVKEIAFQ